MAAWTDVSHTDWEDWRFNCGVGWDLGNSVSGCVVFWYCDTIRLDFDFKSNLSCLLDFILGDLNRDKFRFWDAVRLDFDLERDWT